MTEPDWSDPEPDPSLLAQLPHDELIVRHELWGEMIVVEAPVEFVTSAPKLWEILGNPARWPEFTIVAPEGFSLIGGIMTVNGTNTRPRYTITDYMPEVDGYWLERLPEL